MRLGARSGQVAVYMVMIIVVICLLALMNVDAFVAARAKSRAQNAGDAAALAAARRQEALLNRIGRLNVEHVSAALDGNAKRCEEIVMEQRRLMLLGPLDAIREASDAAAANLPSRRAEDDGGDGGDGGEDWFGRHARIVASDYAGGSGAYADPYPEPYPGAWTEYASAIQLYAGADLAAMPENIEMYYTGGRHWLLRQDFYDAVAGRDWCWFHFNCESLLENYSGREDWGELPAKNENAIGNCEYFSLHLRPRDCRLLGVMPAKEVGRLLETYAGARVPLIDIATNKYLNAKSAWFFFDDDAWRPWFSGYRLAGEDASAAEFPVVGSARPEYNVLGCAAACSSGAALRLETTGASAQVEWAAAAKPFGTVTDAAGEVAPANALAGFVVPCFSAVRLVPLDAIPGGSTGLAGRGWLDHVRTHLEPYLELGILELVAGCFYCDQLRQWEQPSFRREGVRWLKYNAGRCVRPSGGGSLPGGGTRHGH